MTKHINKAITILLSMALIIACSAVTIYASDEPSFDLSIASGEIGETVEVELNIVNNPGITALSVDIDYSEQDVELLNVEDGGLFDSSISLGRLDASPLKLSWYDADSQNRMESGTLATLRFRIRENAVSSRVSVSYDPDNVFDNSLQNQIFETKNGRILVNGAKIGDVNRDGEITIGDVTEIQRHIAECQLLDDEQMILADTNDDGIVDINDATLLQQYIAKFDVVIGKQQ